MLGTKEDVMELENNIDEYIFFQFQSAYQDLLTELTSKYGEKAHDVLMEYLEYRNQEAMQTELFELLDIVEGRIANGSSIHLSLIHI